MIIGTKEQLVRFSFVQVWEPKAMEENGALKYSVQVVIPKTHTAIINTVKAEIEKAKKSGVAKGLYTEAATKNPAFRVPLRDGDQEAAEQTNGSRDYLKGCVFFNASAAADRQPAVVDKYARPIMLRDDFYSGCYGIADINFYAFRFGKGGVAAGLNSLMKREDGDHLDGRVPAKQVFSAFVEEEGEELTGSEGQLV